jgi:hypothetical protein
MKTRGLMVQTFVERVGKAAFPGCALNRIDYLQVERPSKPSPFGRLAERHLSRFFRLALFPLLCIPTFGYSATWVVDGAGGGDFLTIQAAVDAAGPGDSVLVRAGLYRGRVNVSPEKDGLHLIGDGPPGTVIVTADSVVILVARTDPALRIENLTITGGGTFGALHIQEAKVEVVNCIFRNNHCPVGMQAQGGAIDAVLHSDLLLEECIIENNTGWEVPGGVIIWQSRGDVRRNVFRGNRATWGGGLEMYHCDTEPVSYIEDNLFVDNGVTDWGGGLFIVNSCPIVRRNTFYKNTQPGNAAIWVLGGTPTISQNLIAGSDWGVYCQTHPQYLPSLPVMGCNLFWGLVQGQCYACPNLGTVIEANPLFCDVVTQDFFLCENSPALSDLCSRLGAFDMGCPPCQGDPVTPMSWGAIKSLFR